MENEIRRQLEERRYAAAFDLLVDHFKDRVFRLAFSVLQNEAQAEDAAQDAFLKIWKALPDYHGGASLSTWIYAITRNTCLSELKKRASRPTISLHQPEMAVALERLPEFQSTNVIPGSEMDVQAMLAVLPAAINHVMPLSLDQYNRNLIACGIVTVIFTVCGMALAFPNWFKRFWRAI